MMTTSGRPGIKLVLFLAPFLAVAVAAQWAGIYRNASPSMPAGLYRKSSSGSLALVCPPEEWADLSMERGYRFKQFLRACPDGGVPLLKPIVARVGDTVVFSEDGIRVNSRWLKGSAPLPKDSHGRPLTHFPYGIYPVPAGWYWVASQNVYAFDSRYFGPVSEGSILSRMVPLITF